MTEQRPPEQPERPGGSEIGPISDEDIVTRREDPWGLDLRTGMPPRIPGLDPTPFVGSRDDGVNSSDDW
jgi:hypothetical protein